MIKYGELGFPHKFAENRKVVMFGAADGIPTRDLFLGKEAFYC